MKKETQDRLWSILSKEERESLRDGDSLPSLTEYAKGYNHARRFYFGHHNLTSDEEPGEMLTVPRKRAIEEYEKATADLSRTGDLEYQGRRDMVAELFGKDKCIPDPSEEKPTPKFKCGDKVMIVAKNTARTGREAEIVSIKENLHPDFPYFVKGELDTGGVWTGSFKESDLAPYTEPKFKIGDKVRILECGRIGYVAVVQISDDGYVYELTDSNSRLIGIYNATEIEPYTEPQTENKDDMEEKELNLCELLVNQYNDSTYSPIYGEVDVTDIACDRLVIKPKHSSDNSVELFPDGRFSQNGDCQLWPSRDLYLKYPLEAAKAWEIWKSERTPKRWRAKDGEYYYRFDAMFSCVKEMENGGSTDNTYYGHGNYFQTREECFKAAEAVKRTLEEFREKNAEQ